MKTFFIILFYCLLIHSLSAQVIKANINVDFEHLQTDEQQYLLDIKMSLEDYYNNHAWTEDEYETDVEINIYIIIENVRQKSFERIYKAQFQIKSSTGDSFYDRSWEFPYQPGYPLEHNKVQFDPITHFLDFYAFMILAGELDTYDHLLGTPYYEAAQELANRGILSQYSRGWSARLDDVQKSTNSFIRPLREAKPDFFEAVYLLEEGKKKQAKKYAMKVIAAIENVISKQPNNKFLKLFFDGHYVEFAKIFEADNVILEKLCNYDSPHRELYRSVMK